MIDFIILAIFLLIASYLRKTSKRISYLEARAIADRLIKIIIILFLIVVTVVVVPRVLPLLLIVLFRLLDLLVIVLAFLFDFLYSLFNSSDIQNSR